MGIGGTLQELGRFIDQCEQRQQVDGVTLTDDYTPGAAGRVSADIELTLSTSPSGEGPDAVSITGTSVDDTGALSLTLETGDGVVPERAEGIELEHTDASFNDDGTLSVTVTASTAVAAGATGDVDTAADGGTVADESDDAGPQLADDPSDWESTPTGADDSKEESAANPAPARDDTVPPFRDPDLLREVYESCDTFAEMSDAIGMDVTAETVRRYMIDAGIHEPNSYDTTTRTDGASEPAEAESDVQPPVVLTDGVGLPDDVTVDSFVDTVKSSSTIYEVETGIGVTREEARQMLEELGLIGHVVGRLSTRDEREVSRELVIERLRQNAQSG